MTTVTGTAPAYWASYLINGDASGIDDSDVEQADKFAAWLGGNIVSCSDDSFFAHYHDARQFGTLAADCLEYTALIHTEV